ncbi:hypothetical protein RhiirA1_473192 [Rhizophagus irregularis]|uniref:Uncharacterized protein n=2 Tax=Rhizophagus irregularis TaxID=588596 RepID=A0A2N0R112_9GLOM|nr:hypothetical protein RhiirA1_473192 [Rhizophagus irregularis]
MGRKKSSVRNKVTKETPNNKVLASNNKTRQDFNKELTIPIQESLTEVNDRLKDSESTTESTNTSPLLQSRSMKDSDSDSEPERFDPFHLVVDDVDDERAASVNALDDLAMPSSNTQSSNNDKPQKESTSSAPAVDSSAPATIQTSDLQLALSQQPNIVTLLSTLAQIVTATSLTAPASLLSNGQHTTTTNQKIIDQSPQANDSQLINLFINECKTLFIRIRKPTPQLVLQSADNPNGLEQLNFNPDFEIARWNDLRLQPKRYL